VSTSAPVPLKYTHWSTRCEISSSMSSVERFWLLLGFVSYRKHLVTVWNVAVCLYASDMAEHRLHTIVSNRACHPLCVYSYELMSTARVGQLPSTSASAF